MVPAENVTVYSGADRCPNCSSPAYPEVDVTKVVVLGIVLVVFAVFGVLGNILVILSVLFHHQWRSVTHYFIANLAAADLLLSSAVLPFSATSEALGRWVFGRSFCSVWAALDVLCCTASILSLCVISIDRYLAVSYPLRYPAIATGRRGLAAVAALWGLSAAISVGPLFGWKEPDPEDETECRITEEPGYALFSALGSFYIPLAIILAMYCRVYTVARRETKTLSEGSKGDGVETEGVMLRIHRGNAAQKVKQEDENEVTARHKHATFSLPSLLKFSREKKAAKTLGIVVGCFILCWLPFFLVLPIGSIFPSCKPPETIFKITFWLGYLNSCINPIIYPCFNREFKKAFQNVLRGRCLRTGMQTAKSQGHMNTHPSSLGPTSNTSVVSAQSCVNLSSWCCCRALSTSSSSVGGPDQAQSAQIQSKSLLKAWCFSASQTPVPQNPSSQESTKVLRLSLGITGEAV
ncbi:alpha-1A adrenergic receptor [Larimichthys crocea]|uniref:alpha-1A adrenergic receptor n=1 Tax=Larimichthys crocea TaxID=215358 RepID=UPI000F5E4057|nr:alpha-1A adrenergic receptor [Larimichthys crocea]XP_027134365.1 alpha-1A adrenergic receptor [Larimichthys crocea]XP_027134366.1 alpha-1A adrenergic receptor [Larimichthys crocea]